MQKFTECLGCNNLLHVPACTKSLNLNNSNIIPTIDLYQLCLADTLPFQTLDELEYEFTMNENNVSEDDMDRLRHLKFNPFDMNNNIAMSENNANLDQLIKINCEYYTPGDLHKQTNKAKLNNTNSFSMIKPNIRSILNKFDLLKHLLN